MIGSTLRKASAASKRTFTTVPAQRYPPFITYGSNTAFVIGYVVVFGSVGTMMHRRFQRQEARSAMKGAPYIAPQGLAQSDMAAYKMVHQWS